MSKIEKNRLVEKIVDISETLDNEIGYEDWDNLPAHFQIEIQKKTEELERAIYAAFGRACIYPRG